jgi:predicted nucleic acid-binding protein
VTGDGPVVVADANVYVDAVAHDHREVLGNPPTLRHIPSLPPRSVHPALHVLGVVRDGSDTGAGPALAVSDHILLMVVHALLRQGRSKDTVRSYVRALRALAERSTGGYHADVPRTQYDSDDPEDNRILDLAAHVDADLIVTNDDDLLRLGRRTGWKGRPIITPEHFAGLADAAARQRKT